MPIVTRLLDAFFRTLDAVDAARERIDRVLGRTPEPVVTSWDAVPAEGGAPEWQQTRPSTWDDKAAPVRAPKSPSTSPPAPAAPAAKSARPAKSKPAKSAASTSSAASAKKSGGKKKASRKGSVDRTGADVDSPRARAVLEKLKSDAAAQVITEDALLEGKKVLARVVWALFAAEEAGSEQGLTAADASALLHLSAGMEVFSTNIARACRDETHLIQESQPDGRSKRYKLTAQGRAAAVALAVRPLASVLG
jgi:hypothetical protein